MGEDSQRIAVYTGSFDPITLGHYNVIERSSRLVDRLIVGVGVNVEKRSLFTPDERADLVRRTTSLLGNVEVHQFTGLAVSFVRAVGAHGVAVRSGITNAADPEAAVHDYRRALGDLPTDVRQS